MKTPDEIKEGLECCIVGECKSKQRTCPYRKDSDCTTAIIKDALAYIRQLEVEWDALLNETKGFCTSCAFREKCHKRGNVISDIKLTLMHLGDCKHWQWRGSQEVMNEKT